jgi:H+/Cl- antiporter ClcA
VDHTAEQRGRQPGWAAVWCRRLLLAGAAGVLAGVSSFVFLEVLDRVTRTRLRHPDLVLLLPVAGLALGLAATRAGRATEGNALVMAELRRPTDRLPWRMAPFALVGAWTTHLFGGSAGREGIALQMSASLADQLPRLPGVRPLDAAERRTLLGAGLAGGFGAVFGVPLAATVFALEVQPRATRRWNAVVPAALAAFAGDAVVRGLGHGHPHRPALHPGLGPRLLALAVLAGLLFGLAGSAFVRATLAVRHVLGRLIARPPLRPAVGGLAVLGLAALAGRDYLGLSLPLLERAVAGEHLAVSVFALKLLLTAVTVGSGFPGGEVTPLFVMGTTLGAALASPFGLDATLLAALGLAAVFAAAARTPLAGAVLTVELFGGGVAVPALLVCIAAALTARACGGHGIYGAHDEPATRLSGVRRAHRAGRAAVRRRRCCAG